MDECKGEHIFLYIYNASVYYDSHIYFAFYREVAQDELNAADQEKIIGIAVLTFISLVTVVFYFFVKNALSVIRVRAITANMEICGVTQLLCLSF